MNYVRRLAMRFSFFYVFILCLPVTTGCSSPVIYHTVRAESKITVDGWDDDWEKSSLVVMENRLAAGLKYDDHFLYIGVAPLTRQTAMQIMISGFTVWFDSTGSGKKSFGIHYPVGTPDDRSMPLQLRPPLGQKKEQKDPLEEFMKNKLREAEIIQNGLRSRLLVAELEGIELRINMRKEGMFYEIKVPVAGANPYPFEFRFIRGKPFSVGFETGEFKSGHSGLNNRTGSVEGGGSGDGERKGFGGGRPPGGPVRREGNAKPGAFRFWMQTVIN